MKKPDAGSADILSALSARDLFVSDLATKKVVSL
jgi:hypothetical protein